MTKASSTPHTKAPNSNSATGASQAAMMMMEEHDRFAHFKSSSNKQAPKAIPRIFGHDINPDLISDHFKAIALNLSSSMESAASASFTTEDQSGYNNNVTRNSNSIISSNNNASASFLGDSTAGQDETTWHKSSTPSTYSPATTKSGRDWRVVGEGSNASLLRKKELPKLKNFRIAPSPCTQESKYKNSSDIFNPFASILTRGDNSGSASDNPDSLIPDVLKQVMDMQVKVHKSIAQNPDLRAVCTWKGSLTTKVDPLKNSPRMNSRPIYSRKVFAGGVPWEATESSIMKAFLKADKTGKKRIQIEYPSRPSSTTAFISSPSASRNTDSNDGEEDRTASSRKLKAKPTRITNNYFPGYVYLIFDSSDSINSVIEACCSRRPKEGDKLFFQIDIPPHKGSAKKADGQPSTGKTGQSSKKDVELIPFSIEDAEWYHSSDVSAKMVDFDENTAFVGALHGQITAFGLAKIMGELFGEVLKVSLDLDKWKYPIGSGKVVFASRSSLCKALEAGIIEVVTERFKKRIQVDPYLHSSGCCMCHSSTQLTYFCRDNSCFAYFCKDCWFWRHNAPSGDYDSDQNLRTHIPLTR